VLSSAALKAQARELGFDAIGVADARPAWPNGEWLDAFLEHERHGDMSWLEPHGAPAS
jgi:epoxyqueuosine reductase